MPYPYFEIYQNYGDYEIQFGLRTTEKINARKLFLNVIGCVNYCISDLNCELMAHNKDCKQFFLKKSE